MDAASPSEIDYSGRRIAHKDAETAANKSGEIEELGARLGSTGGTDPNKC